MANPTLNYDVLITVLQAVAARQHKADLIPIMQTCRTLQHAGVPLLIRNGIDVLRAESLESFCLFMLADAARSQNLRRLTLTVSGIPQEHKLDFALARVFISAQNLERLYISEPVFLDYYPATTRAIAELTALKTLDLCSGDACREDTLRSLLLRMKSNLHSLAVGFYNCHRLADQPGEVIELLEGVAPRLERLNVNFASFKSNDGPQFPRLKVLSCDRPTYMKLCRPLIRSFPNLTYLDVSDTLAGEAAIEHYRLMNRATQQSLRWHHLAYLYGSLPCLYGLALQCLVTTMRLLVGYHSEDPTMLPAVLSDTPPVNLVTKVDYRFPLSAMPNVFHGAALRLKNLVVTIPLQRAESANPQQLFDSILPTLRETQLTFFRLNLIWEDPSNVYDDMLDDEEDCTQSEPVQLPTEPHRLTLLLQQLDPALCSRHIMEYVPTIKTIVLDWEHGSQPKSFVAVVEEEEGVRSLKVLDEKEGADLCKLAYARWYADVPSPVRHSDMFS